MKKSGELLQLERVLSTVEGPIEMFVLGHILKDAIEYASGCERIFQEYEGEERKVFAALVDIFKTQISEVK